MTIKYIGDGSRVYVPDFGLSFAKEECADKDYPNVRTVDEKTGKALIASGLFKKVK